MSELLDRAIAAGVTISIAFTALAYGATEAWSVGIFELIVVAQLLLWAAKGVVEKRLTVRVPAAAIPVAGLVAIGIAQSVALTDDAGRVKSLSMDVEATRAAVPVLFFLLASFIIAANFFASRERLRSLAQFLVIYGLAMSVFALVQHFTWDGRIYWLRPTEWWTVFGPFANRNHFAGYMEMLAPMPVALIMTRSIPKQAWGFYGFASVIMGVTIVVSLSRGGMVSLAAGMTFLAVASAWVPRPRFQPEGKAPLAPKLLIRAGAVSAIAIAIAVGVVWLGAEGVINRADQTFNQQIDSRSQDIFFSREWVWSDTLRMIRAAPVLGVGLGAYESVYPIYGHSNGMFVVNYAHNDYLQVVSDAGIIGGLLAFAFIALIFRSIFRGIRSKDSLMSGLALGSGAAIFSILVHSLFDFNLQIPSNALLFLVHAAVVSYIGASVNESKRGSERGYQPPARINAGGLATGVR